jgi:putative transcriptional regulator
VNHTPVADDDEDCICFAVTDAPLRLTGPVGRIVQSFFKH